MGAERDTLVHDAPFQSIGDGTLVLTVPIFETINANTLFEISAHVYNTTGYLVDNSSTSCKFHFFNITGHHTIDEYMLYDAVGEDFYFDISARNMSVGFYNILIYCNGTEAGFFEEEIEVTLNANPNPPLNLLAGILGVGIIVFILFYFGFSLDSEHFLLRLLTTFFGLFTLLLIPNILINGIIAATDNMLSILINFIKTFSAYLFVYLNYSIWLKDKLIDWKFIKKPQPNTLQKG